MKFLLKTIASSFLISVAIALLSVTSFAQAPQATDRFPFALVFSQRPPCPQLAIVRRPQQTC